VSVVVIATLPSAKAVTKARIDMRDMVVPFVLSLTRIPPLCLVYNSRDELWLNRRSRSRACARAKGAS
jgi:hypothetical protein